MALLMFCSRVPEAPPKQPPRRPARSLTPPKILHFYAAPPECRPGDPVTICYGVENADRVTIDPKVRELAPSFNRCFLVTPRQSTSYTLRAAGAGGEATATLTIAVQGAPMSKPEAPSLLELLSASSQEITRGQQVTLCYVATNAVAVEIDPPVRELPPHSYCFTLAPAETTTFTVTARDDKNRLQSRQVTVRVR
jgi:hypothetical protein